MTTLGRKSLYLAEISFLLSVVFAANSLVLICEQFLSYTINVFVAFCLLTSCFHTIINSLKLQSANSLYWSAFNLNAAHFTTCSDPTSWTTWRGSVMVVLGFSIVCLYVVYVWCSSSWTRAPVRHGDRDRDRYKDGVEETDLPGEEVVDAPLAVQLSFVFIGNGVAMMGRLFLPDHGCAWSFVGGGIMLCVSVMFFCGYLCLFSRTRGDNTRVHAD